jgi:hypothetical protein
MLATHQIETQQPKKKNNKKFLLFRTIYLLCPLNNIFNTFGYVDVPSTTATRFGIWAESDNQPWTPGLIALEQYEFQHRNISNPEHRVDGIFNA